MEDEADRNVAIVQDADGTIVSPSSDGGWYLYGITRRRPEYEATLVLGLDGKPPLRLPCGELVAIASRVSMDADGIQALRSRLQDPAAVTGWLEEMVRGHERVVEVFQREQGVLPARFGCVYASADDLVTALACAHDALNLQLKRLEGCDEWGTRLYADRAKIQQIASGKSPSVQQLQRDLAAAGPGRAYFLRRKLADALAELTTQTLSDLAQRCYDHLAGRAIASRVNRRRDGLGPPPDEAEILRAAFLVPRTGLAAFVEEMHRFTESHEGLRCEYSGPWPAYSFSTLDEEIPR